MPGLPPFVLGLLVGLGLILGVGLVAAGFVAPALLVVAFCWGLAGVLW